MIRMCEEILNGKDVNDIDCIVGAYEHIYCIHCIFSQNNNSDNKTCVQRGFSENRKIAKEYIELFRN